MNDFFSYGISFVRSFHIARLFQGGEEKMNTKEKNLKFECKKRRKQKMRKNRFDELNVEPAVL